MMLLLVASVGCTADFLPLVPSFPGARCRVGSRRAGLVLRACLLPVITLLLCPAIRAPLMPVTAGSSSPGVRMAAIGSCLGALGQLGGMEGLQTSSSRHNVHAKGYYRHRGPTIDS